MLATIPNSISKAKGLISQTKKNLQPNKYLNEAKKIKKAADLIFFGLPGEWSRGDFAQDDRDVFQDGLGVLVPDDDQAGQRQRVEVDDVDKVADLER